MGFFKEMGKAFADSWRKEFGDGKFKAEMKQAFIEGWENGWSGGSGLYVKGREVSNAEIERTRRAYERHVAERERQQKEMRQALEGQGVNVEAIVEEKITTDAADIANGLCRARLRRDAEPSNVGIDWRPLTKSGKVPKCVAKTVTVWDRRNGDSVIVHLGYTADARPYTADVHIWTDDERYTYKVRTVDGDLAVTGEGQA